MYFKVYNARCYFSVRNGWGTLMQQMIMDLEDQDNTLDDVFENIVGVIPDTGKTLEEYREERITERYGTVE